MKPTEVSAAIEAAYECKQPLMIWGAPGCAKSSVGAQTADRMKIDFIDLRLSLLESIDLRGLPVVDNGKFASVKWVPPSFLPSKGKGILMLDEIVQAAPSMQAAASQLILDRRIGEYKLPDGWLVIGAGNRKSDRATVNAMPTHIANRFVHVTQEVSVDDWIAWALQNNIDMRVIAFLKWRSALLHQFDPQAKGEAFPSPRTWEFVSKLLGTKLGQQRELQLPVIKGAVGEGAGGEFVGFLRVFDKLPSIDAILMNPSTVALPTDPAVLYAVTTTIVSRMSKDNVGKFSKFFDRIKDAGNPEFAVLALQASSREKPEITNTRAYIEWASNMSSFIA